MAQYAQTFDRVMNGSFEEATDQERRRAVQEIIHIGSTAAAAVAFQPFPLVDLVLVSPIQIAMVQAIGKIYGHKLDRKSVLEILSTFGASILAQSLVMSAAKFVPVAGWLAGISMAYALTYAIGECSEHYFRTGRGVPQEDLKSMFRKVYGEKRKEKMAAHKNDASLKERLEQLNAAFAAGLLTPEEYEAKKRDILSAF